MPERGRKLVSNLNKYEKRVDKLLDYTGNEAREDLGQTVRCTLKFMSWDMCTSPSEKCLWEGSSAFIATVVPRQIDESPKLFDPHNLQENRMVIEVLQHLALVNRIQRQLLSIFLLFRRRTMLLKVVTTSIR